MEKFILTFDQGTTSSRAILFDKNGKIKSLAQKEFTQYYPKPGWVEHDPMEIWTSQAAVATEAILKAGCETSQVAAIGITNQRETTIVWDRQTGDPVYRAIVWQDRRTAEYCEELKGEGKEELIREKTGLMVDSYFSATKIRWILENVPGAREKAEAGELAFGTVDSWLIWNLTDKQVHVTDVTNASRTMIYNIHSLEWDKELLSLFNIPESMLPEVRSSSEVYAHTSGKLLSVKIPIAGIAGDQQSALFGQLCLKPGMVKNTYGTGCFMLMNIGSKPRLSKNKLVTTIAWKIGDEVQYALEGSIFIAGAIVQWLRDEMKLIDRSDEIENLAESVDDNNGVYIVPAFAGLGAPYWNPYARGTIFGITRGTNKGHFARAALESIAYQTMDILTAMKSDAEVEIAELRVDGGATKNNLLLQFQADVLQCRVVRPEMTELTAIGAAYLAGLAVGFWKSTDELHAQWAIDRQFEPEHNREEEIRNWAKAIRATEAWTKNTH